MTTKILEKVIVLDTVISAIHQKQMKHRITGIIESYYPKSSPFYMNTGLMTRRRLRKK
jgi:hypothetical protein